jgi:hypothetical protein
MVKLLTEKGYYFSSTFEKEAIRDLKENHCAVALS